MSFSEATAAPITRVINDTEYKFSIFTLSMLGQLEQWIKDLFISKAIAQTKEADADTKKIILEQAYKESNSYSLSRDNPITDTLEVIHQMMFISLSKLSPSISKSDAMKIFDMIDIDESTTLIKQFTNQSTDEKKTIAAT